MTIDEATLATVDRVGKPLGLTRSEIVRRALREWIRRQAVDTFEQAWIAGLRSRPDTAARADEWLAVQAWSEK